MNRRIAPSALWEASWSLWVTRNRISLVLIGTVLLLPISRILHRIVLMEAAITTMDTLIPMPVSATTTGGTFTLTAETAIYVNPASEELTHIGQYLAERLNRATGYNMRVLPTESAPRTGNIYLIAGVNESMLADEGYELTITPDAVTLVANKPEGVFQGLQTIRQLLPPAIESETTQPGLWTMPTAVITEHPRFAYRGVMLDVARHFFSVADVKRLLDEMAYYKLNRLHLHLTDDQGWRIVINSWPNLAAHGGSTEVGGGPGGYYTQADYADLVAYAAHRYIMIVPEVDMPGHTNAALASYANLNCSGVAPDLYTGTEVGFSTLCTTEEITYTFIDDVVRELAALTPGPYIHIGGDESAATDPADYLKFVERVQGLVQAHGKQAIGWGEIAQSKLLPSTVVQHWHTDVARRAVGQGAKIVMSPASRAYLDMQYDPSTPLGLHWAGYINLDTGYRWDPATEVPGIGETDILGIEAPLWTETVETLADIEYMVFPRLLGYAEIGWSPAQGRSWEEYQGRLAAHGPRLAALGVNFYRSPLIAWR